MRSVLLVLTLGFVGMLSAQTPVPSQPCDALANPAYVCPMDPDVRSNNPGSCARCGMKLVEGIPDPVEFHLDLTITPSTPRPGQAANLKFVVHDPWKDRPVTKFLEVHEKLFHAFVVSQDLQFFIHNHTTFRDVAFYYDLAFPKPGLYLILGDFYPDGATPQLIAKAVVIPGTPPATVKLPRDYSTKDAQNIRVDLETIPPQPIAGQKTQMYF